MILPSGDTGSSGLIVIGNSVRNFEKSVGLSEEDFAKRERLLVGDSEEISKFCDPTRNPTSFSNCQEAASGATEGLLLLAELGKRFEGRVAAFTALARMTFGSPGNAAAAAESQHLVPAIQQALRPIAEMVQQEEHIVALHLLQALAASVPEAPCIAALLGTVVDLASGSQEGYPACRAARTMCIEVLVSSAMTPSRKRQIAKLLPVRTLDKLLDESDVDTDMRIFPLGMLLACLCDCFVHDDQGPAEVTIGEYGRPFWESSRFFASLAGCLSAALEVKEWPPGSGLYHRTWKLAHICKQLSAAGHAAELVESTASIVALVEWRARASAQEEVPDADKATAARLAASALRWLCSSEAAVAVMREAADLSEALRQMEGEEAAAGEILRFLEAGQPIEGVCEGVTRDAAPF